MKILVLNGSPKKKSDTFRLTEAFLRGMNRGETHEVHLIHVREKQIAPCRGCFGCWQRGDGHCIIADDQNTILDLYREADVIIWSFPLYCYGMPSPLKAVLDRTIPLVKMRMVICGCGFPDWDGNFDGLKMMCKTCFGNPDMVCVPETPLMNVPEAAVVADPLLKRFEEAGAEYANRLTLSPETVATLERPMIPKEEYIRNVNGG